jgi:hypothetical protein
MNPWISKAKKETTDASTDDCSCMPTSDATGATGLTGQADKTVFLLQIIKVVSSDEPAGSDSDWAWDSQSMRTTQLEDPELSKIMKWLESGGPRPEWKDMIAPAGMKLKYYWNQWDCLELKDGIL